MIKSWIGRISRWIRRVANKYCTIELDKNARGLAKCLVRGPLTKEEKAERYRRQLLRGVKDEDKDKVINHFDALSKEADPLKNVREIPDDSVKKVGMNISVEDVQDKTRKVQRENNTANAEKAIKGLIPWPVPSPNNTERKT